MSAFTDAISAAARNTNAGLTTGEPGGPVRRSWAEVSELAARMAGGLAAAGLPARSRVAILAGDPGDIAPLIQAVWLRAGAATMLHQPTHRTHLPRWISDTLAVLETLDAHLVVVGKPFESALPVLREHGINAIAVEALDHAGTVAPLPCTEDDIALLQLTSGSTGHPKAVLISHRNLDCHNRAIAVTGRIDPARDVMVSWLPMFHDMGLVGFLLLPMWAGLNTVCTTPDEFLRAPLLWPSLITKYHGTVTAAPNFAYAMLAQRLRRADGISFDLSSLRIALNGAEPIDDKTISTLLAAGHRFGLHDTALIAAYGMAEATLAISITDPDRPVGFDLVDGDAVRRRGFAEPCTDAAPHARRLVELGQPLPGVQVRVVGNSGQLGPRGVGELELRGASITRGYLTREGFRHCLDPEGWFRTGDLGYRTESGAIVVCGRSKETIIVAGRNIFPADIEHVAERVRGVRPGNIVAVRTDRRGRRDNFVIVVESELHDDPVQRNRIEHEITALVYNEVGAGPDTVTVTAPRTLPKTPSGKPRRQATLAMVNGDPDQ